MDNHKILNQEQKNKLSDNQLQYIKFNIKQSFVATP